MTGTGVYWGFQNAAGSGRFLEIAWNQGGLSAIVPSTPTRLDGTSFGRPGTSTTTAIWTVNNAATATKYDYLQGQLCGQVGNPAGQAWTQYGLSVPYSPSIANLDFDDDSRASFGQMAYEIEACFSGTPADTSIFNCYVLGCARGNGPTFGVGATNTQWMLAIDQLSRLVFVQCNGTTMKQTVLSGINPLHWNRYAVRFIRPTKSQIPQFDVYVNNVRQLSLDLRDASFPALPVLGLNQMIRVFGLASDTGTANKPGVAIGARSARMIAGPLSNDVFPLT